MGGEERTYASKAAYAWHTILRRSIRVVCMYAIEDVGNKLGRRFGDNARAWSKLAVLGIGGPMETADAPCGDAGEICVRIGQGRIGAGSIGERGRVPSVGVASELEQTWHLYVERAAANQRMIEAAKAFRYPDYFQGSASAVVWSHVASASG